MGRSKISSRRHEKGFYSCQLKANIKRPYNNKKKCTLEKARGYSKLF